MLDISATFVTFVLMLVSTLGFSFRITRITCAHVIKNHNKQIVIRANKSNAMHLFLLPMQRYITLHLLSILTNFWIIFFASDDVVHADITATSSSICGTDSMLAAITARCFKSRHKGAANVLSKSTKMLMVSTPQNYCNACSISTPFMHGRCNVCNIHCQLRFSSAGKSITLSLPKDVARSLCKCDMYVLLNTRDVGCWCGYCCYCCYFVFYFYALLKTLNDRCVIDPLLALYFYTLLY